MNIFRNIFISKRVDIMLEAHWREAIAQDIESFGGKIQHNMPLTEEDIHHGEILLKEWAKYITDECANIARKNRGE